MFVFEVGTRKGQYLRVQVAQGETVRHRSDRFALADFQVVLKGAAMGFNFARGNAFR